MSELKICSDFCDFYDKLSTEGSLVTYKRYLSECKQRGVALQYLRNLGVKTIEIRQVSKYIPIDGDLVVYTDPMLHSGNGKRIMSVIDAQRSYNNYVASIYIRSTDPLTVKYLQIGKRRFNLYYRKRQELTLDAGDLVDIREIPSDYNRLIALPIYSIDYIQYNNEMLATDFNEVQNLHNIGFERFMTAEQIINEIRDSILIYNKA